MQVDNPLSSSFNFQPNFEDFFNMDLIAGPSSGTAPSTGASSSRSSSGSPSQSFATLPPTPPNPFSIPDPTIGSYFNFLDDDFSPSKVDPLAPPPTTAAPFDFFAPFAATSSPSSLQTSSPHSAITSESSPAATDSPLGIDPQLVGTPAQPKSANDFDEEDEDDNEDQDLDDDHDSPLTQDQDLPLIPTIKVGGRGKAARKGTVQSGGVVKKSSVPSSPAPERKEKYLSSGILTTTSVEPDDWRPTPEEYKKMSSKEKRQLRNKISARNFRVRRKEYISTLEGDIAERDRLIDCIRTELMGTKSENVTLRQEIQTLKRALLDGRGLPTTPVLPPPAPLPELPAAALASPSSPSKQAAPPTPKSPLLTPNTRKDLPTSPRLGARNFWGGASAGMGGFGGITPVHTTLIPEWSSVLSGKAQNAYPKNTTSSALQENINPLLNGITSTTLAELGYLGQSQKNEGHKDVGTPALNLNAFDSFADKNLFTLKSMEDFRMQLWTRMGQQQSQSRQLQQHLSQQALLQQSQPSQPSGPNGLASGIRPHYFSKQSPTLSAILSGKASTSSYPTPPPSPPMRNASPTTNNAHTSTSSPTPTEQQALLASIASQTLVKKLGSAFWDAFSGSSGSPLAGAGVGVKKEWDADKVRKVLEGKAVVRVVDVDPSPSSSSSSTSLTPTVPIASSSSVVKEGKENALGGMSAADKLCPKAPVCFSALEEKLKNLHL